MAGSCEYYKHVEFVKHMLYIIVNKNLSIYSKTFHVEHDYFTSTLSHIITRLKDVRFISFNMLRRSKILGTVSDNELLLISLLHLTMKELFLNSLLVNHKCKMFCQKNEVI